MIIRPREAGLKVSDFLSGLRRASRSAVRVGFINNPPDSSDTLGARSTGWLLTDRLLVVSMHLKARARLDYLDDEGLLRQADAEVIFSIQSPEQPMSLLRLHEQLPERAVSLNLEIVKPGDQVFILHFPHGQFEQEISLGRVIEVNGPLLRYDANTVPGSGGAPVFDSQWRLIGMHQGVAPEEKANFGVTMSKMLEHLRGTDDWPDIAVYHRVADVDAARQHLELRTTDASVNQPPDNALLGAAVRWSFDPKEFSEEDAAALRRLVIDPSAPRWILRANERQNLLRTAASLEALRKARGTSEVPERGQKLIDQILDGVPMNLETTSEESLSDLLQVSRWFAGLAPSLPSPNEVNRTLKRRRLKSRLGQIAAPSFKGRRSDLDKLRSWYSVGQQGPMVVTGIGGMGKSALAARFATELPPDALLFWLDFDRVDLAPDDAVSVVEALSEQAAAQINEFQPLQVEQENWRAAAKQLGQQLARSPEVLRAPPLLVLDSFEVAQYAERHQELWPVLETLSSEVPSLRVLVTGRAAVKNLTLQGRSADSLQLKGLEPQDARAWLHEKGIQQGSVLERVLGLAKGVPLILVLAVHLVDAGGKVTDLPERLPQKIIEGLLYQRILDRVQDFSLRPLAMGALVLRRLTADMVGPVLGGLIELPSDREPAQILADLAREMALVEGTDVLRLRSDVRSATLGLLEQDRAELVREIDMRAADWYARQDLTDPAIAAELVYHRLRLGDLAGAEAAWRDGCAANLQFAAEDLRDEARAWLQERIGDVGEVSPSTPIRWERDAVERIRAALSRGLWRALPEILWERRERSEQSPLVFFDAYVRWRAGDRDAAWSVLDEAGDATGAVSRNRIVLRALLAAEEDDRRTADEWLARIDSDEHWHDRPQGNIEAQAVRAARVRLTVDLPAEIELLGLFSKRVNKGRGKAVLRPVLPPEDVTLPRLRRWLRKDDHERLESEPGFILLTHPQTLSVLAGNIYALHTQGIASSDLLTPVVKLLIDTAIFGNAWSPDELPRHVRTGLLGLAGMKKLSESSQRMYDLGLSLLLLGLRRWNLVTRSTFLADAYNLAARNPETVDPLLTSVVGTLALFGDDILQRSKLLGPEGSVADVVERCLYRLGYLPMSRKRLQFATHVLRKGGHQRTANAMSQLALLHSGKPEGQTLIPFGLLDDPDTPESERALVRYLLTPDPLERLVHQLAGIPSSVEP